MKTTAAVVVILLATAASVLAMDGCDNYTKYPGDNYKCGHLCLVYHGDCNCGGTLLLGRLWVGTIWRTLARRYFYA